MRSVMLAMVIVAADGTREELPSAVAALLDSGKWDSTPKAFRIIALSHVADGCASSKDRACIERVLERAKALPQSGDALFLTHLNLIYGAADQLGPCLDEKDHARLSETLARKSLADPLAHAPSYAAVAYRWPADQSATLASLGRYDRAHGTAVLTEPLKKWEAVMASHLDAKTGLPWSEVTGRAPGAKLPRGCAQSFISRYLAEVDPVLAATWWAAYRNSFFVRLGPVAGFREWPLGVERPGDVDSGPIVMGIGAAASAFAISAAKAQGDEGLAAQLEGAAETVKAMGVGGAAAKTVLAEAIAFEARWHSAQ